MIHRLSLAEKPHLKCNNTPGSFECECKVGFTHELSDPTKLCLDLGSYFQIISVENYHITSFQTSQCQAARSQAALDYLKT